MVSMIAADIVAEVCSAYVLRGGEYLELFATEGLRRSAVHRPGCGSARAWSALIAAHGAVINLPDAQSHPDFAYRPGDRRGDLPLVPGRADRARRPGHRRAGGPEPHAAPLLRGGGRGAADHRHGVRRDGRLGRPGRRRPQFAGRSRPRRPARAARRACGWSRAWRSAMRCCISCASRSPGWSPRIPRREAARLEAAIARPARLDRRAAAAARGRRRRAPRGARGLPHVRPRRRLAAAACARRSAPA